MGKENETQLTTNTPKRDDDMSTIIGRERALAKDKNKTMRIVGGNLPDHLVVQVFDSAKYPRGTKLREDAVSTYTRQTLQDFEAGIITSDKASERVNFKIGAVQPGKSKKKAKTTNIVEEQANSKNFAGQLAFELPNTSEMSGKTVAQDNAHKVAGNKREAKARTKYLGAQQKASNGMMMTVIEYRDYHDVDVQFEDLTIVKHKEMGAFKRGQIAHPTVQTVPQKHDPAAVKKLSVTKRQAKERKGETRMMRCGYVATIINYIDSGNITVRFEDNCKKQKVAYAQFIIGCVAHPKKLTKPLPENVNPGDFADRPVITTVPANTAEVTAPDVNANVSEDANPLFDTKVQAEHIPSVPVLAPEVSENEPAQELDSDDAIMPIQIKSVNDASQTISLNITIPKEMLTQDNITLNIKLN